MRGKMLAVVLCLCTTVFAQDFKSWFADRTLRVDYVFTGDTAHQEISVGELVSHRLWAGRRHRLDSLAVEGNGQIEMRDSLTGRVIYRTSFSSLFQEWLGTKEATQVRRSFENPLLLPMPLRTAVVKIQLTDFHRRPFVTLTHLVRPSDALIRCTDSVAPPAIRYLQRSGQPQDCIDVAIVAEGYTPAEMDRFYADADTAMASLFRHEPFKTYRNRFNIVAVGLPSLQSGVSEPQRGIWRQTALGSNFDTFYSDRYLTTLRLNQLHEKLTGVPYEHIIILANTDSYGGGGIYNSYMLTTAHHRMFKPVVVHEFGHSFAGLADEYFYDDQYEEMYPSDVEPWEQNITTLKDFASKWKDMLPPKTKIPTQADHKAKNIYTKIGVYEGGGYRSKGVYRAFQECRMKINEAPAFCPVCQRALARMIQFYTE